MALSVTGIFPVRCTGVSSGLTLLSHPSHEVIEQNVPTATALSLIESDVNAAIARSAMNFSSAAPSAVPATHFGPYYCKYSGSLTPIQDRLYNLEPETVSIPNFKVKVKNGAIICTDYFIGGLVMSYQHGYTSSQPSARSLSKTMTSCGLFELEKVSVVSYVRRGGQDLRAGSFYLGCEYLTRTYDISPFDVGWEDKIIINYFDTMKAHVNVGNHYGLITETTADANRATVDILTAMAEMPETLRSILSACVTIVKLYRDARNKEFRIKNRVKGNPSSLATANAQWRKDKKDAADAIASVWLNFRYNIMPNVYLIRDSLDLIDKVGTRYERWRNAEKFNQPLTFNLPTGWSCDKDTIEALTRVFIKRGFSVGDKDFKHLLSANIFTTAYELVPLSFVLDWVINVGDFITSSTSPGGTYRQGATISWSIEDTITFTHQPSGARVTCDVRTYKRKSINPNDYCRLNINPEMNPYRWADSAALAWKLLISKLT